MQGFRKINGVNWLSDINLKVLYTEDNTQKVESDSLLPIHWLKVKNILLNNK
ncbi:hypothetical protein [Limosilactobacillus reuteri]|uniref:hypothetical protein n=1 Tax=Limosilactobacillus reuteri TaxID=1598 RepID=UPI003D976700